MNQSIAGICGAFDQGIQYSFTQAKVHGAAIVGIDQAKIP